MTAKIHICCLRNYSVCRHNGGPLNPSMYPHKPLNTLMYVEFQWGLNWAHMIPRVARPACCCFPQGYDSGAVLENCLIRTKLFLSCCQNCNKPPCTSRHNKPPCTFRGAIFTLCLTLLKKYFVRFARGVLGGPGFPPMMPGGPSLSESCTPDRNCRDSAPGLPQGVQPGYEARSATFQTFLNIEGEKLASLYTRNSLIILQLNQIWIVSTFFTFDPTTTQNPF